MQSEKIDLLVSALVKVQAAVKPAVKNKVNTYFKSPAHPGGSPYADLESLWESCRKLLSDNNLAVIQTMEMIDGKPVLNTLLAHGSGQWKEGVYPLNPDKPTPQGFGSAITYARRYCFEAILGLVSTEDDDGEAAMDRQTPPPKAQAPRNTNQEALAMAPLPKPMVSNLEDDSPPWPEDMNAPRPDRNPHVGEYMVPFGKKYKGRTLNEIGPQEVQSYLNWLRQEEHKKGGDLKGPAAEFADAAEKFLSVVSGEVPF